MRVQGYNIEKDVKGIHKRLEQARKAIVKQAEDGEQGWLFLPDDREMMKRVQSLVREIRRFENLLVIGIGGSDLGARALSEALTTQKTKGLRLFFAGANTDPDELSAILQQLDLKKTIVNVISKSGDTVEPMTTFFVVWDALVATVGKEDASKQIIATTDAQNGSLRKLADEEGFRTLPVAGNVGGRFSVLTDVGLFPLAAAGIDIVKILQGAKMERDTFLQTSLSENAPIQFAARQYLLAQRGHTIQVLMPYVTRLKQFGFWYRQLWAESLGKKVDINGKVVHTGPTPIAALGATDQHSQLQLYIEGPNDKTVTFIEVENFDSKLRVPKEIQRISSLAYLAKKSFQDILHAERLATATALTEADRPHGTITLDRISPASLGALVLFFELATAVSGELYMINAYDQPGVEAGKKAMKHLLTTG